MLWRLRDVAWCLVWRRAPLFWIRWVLVLLLIGWLLELGKVWAT